jgi:hypothetical protein
MKESSMGKCRSSKLLHGALDTSFKHSSIPPSSPLHEHTFWSTPTFYTSLSASFLRIPLSKPAKYANEPLIQPDTWYKRSEHFTQPISRLHPTIPSNTKSVLPQPPTTEAITMLKRISLWELSQNVNPITKTNTSCKKLKNPPNLSKKIKKNNSMKKKKLQQKRIQQPKP